MNPTLTKLDIQNQLNKRPTVPRYSFTYFLTVNKDTIVPPTDAILTCKVIQDEWDRSESEIHL